MATTNSIASKLAAALPLRRLNRMEVVSRTEVLVKKLLAATSEASKLSRVGELNRHLMEFPASRMVAVQSKLLISRLLGLGKGASKSQQRAKFAAGGRPAAEEELEGEARQCLALCGYVHPPKGKGINILAIDGGGTRGMMGLEVLDEIERHSGGKKIAELFDMIVGVSTGAIIASLVGAKGMQISESMDVYKDISRQLFTQGKFSGVSGLILSHSYYNTRKWVEILKKTIGEDITMVGTSKVQGMPKLALVSCMVNTLQLQPFLFRNYEHPAGRDSHYRGTTHYRLWQAIQASAAAPGYFEEVQLGSILHQDGGVLCNNPTAIALHEARQLWPNEKIACVVSVGNGRSVVEVEGVSPATADEDDLVSERLSLTEKMWKIVDSATDTQLMHNCLSDLLPPNVYFRLNPYMSAPYTLDEILPERLAQMERDAQLYVRRNRRKIEAAATQLTRPTPLWRQLWRRLLLLYHEWGFYRSS